MAVVIRLADVTDTEGMLAVYAPYVRDTAISFEVEPPSAEDFGARVRSHLGHAPWLVCEAEGAILGYAYAGKFHARAAYQWTVEVTVYVHPDRRGTGVGLGLYTALLEGLRLQGFCSAVGIIALPNPASVGLHERLGFARAALLRSVGYKHGRWHDVGWWQLALHEYRGSPPPPRPVASLLATAEWQRALESGARLVRPASRTLA